MKRWTVLLRVSRSVSPGNWYRSKRFHPEYLALLRSHIGRVATGVSQMSLPATSVLDPNRIPAPRDSGRRKGKSRCGSEGLRIRAYEGPRRSARCRLQEDPQTTRHKAERHEEVHAHEDANSDTRLRTHAP